MGFNTNNPLGSSDERDFYDNSANLDKALNSEAENWTDRLGVERPTVDYVLKQAGFTPAGFDFKTGGTLRAIDRNKCVFNQTDQTWYMWQGDLPKTVAANSTPNPLGDNGWKPVSLKGGDIQITTMVELQTGKFPKNALVIITDRGNGLFRIMTDVSPDGFSTLPAGNGKVAVLEHDSFIDPKWFGAKPKTESGAALQACAKYGSDFGIRVLLEDVFFSSRAILIGEPGNSTYVAFEGPNTATQHMGHKAGIKFTNCDGFRIVERSSLGLKNLLIWGDGETPVPYNTYGEYLKQLTFSAVRSNEETMDRNCIAYINNCNFRQWKTCWDFKRGSWSCHFENNYISYCYQAGNHFRPHSSRFIHNTIGYCVRGFELIEQASGKFENNELNAGKYTEYLIKHVKVGVVSCCSNYIEHWESPEEVDVSANYGLGFIPIIVEYDRYQPISIAKIENNLINVPGCYCAILFTPHSSQSQHNNNYRGTAPKDNLVIGVTQAEVVVATTGSGNFLLDEMTFDVNGKKIKSAKLNNATGNVYFCGSETKTIFEKNYSTRAAIQEVVQAGGVLFGQTDIVFDSSLEVKEKGCMHTTDSKKMTRIKINMEVGTDATPAKIKIQICKWESKTKIFEFDIPANSKIPINLDFYQTPEFGTIQNFYCTIENTSTLPNSIKVQAIRTNI